MSLEAAVLANTEAVTALTAAILASNVDRAAALEKLTASGAVGGETTTRKPRGRPAEPVNKTETPTAPQSPPAPEPPTEATEAELMASASGYLDTTDEKVRAERKLFVKAVIDHLGAETVRAIKPADRASAIAWFAEAKATGKPVNFSAGEDENAAEDDMMG